MAKLRLVLTGIEALVPDTYDDLTEESSFPLILLLLKGQECRPAGTTGTTGEDRVIPSHHAFLQFRMRDLDRRSPRRPDLIHFHKGTEYGVCSVDGEYLSLPSFV